MNWDQMEGKWKQVKGSAKQQWGKLTDDDLEIVSGHRDKLIGKLQERYGYAKEDAQKRADEWLKSIEHEPSYAHSGHASGGKQQQYGSPEHTPKR
jgi:uncharacterized protein YjbJ (UPF0337 family)